MNRLSREKRVQIARCLTEGVGVNATTRIVGVSKNTVLRLLTDLGEVCRSYQARTLRDLPCRKLQADEAWAFVHAKSKNLPEELRGQWGFGSGGS